MTILSPRQCITGTCVRASQRTKSVGQRDKSELNKPNKICVTFTRLQAADWSRRLKIINTEQPPTWRLINVPADGDEANSGEMEEKVFTVQGIVCAVALPPLMERPL